MTLSLLRPTRFFLLLAALFLAPATALSAPPAGAIPATLFGMHLTDKMHWPSVPIGALGKGTLINWPYIEQRQGVRDWSNLDAWVNQAQVHGVPFFYADDNFPDWAVTASDPTHASCRSQYGYTACTAMPDLAAWDNFITALVTRYRGRIAMYELFNEPDKPSGFTGTVAQMVTLTQHEYTIIRALDPQARIASPSGSAVYMDQYWAAGGVRTIDVLTYHAYPDPSQYTTPTYPAAERACCENSLAPPRAVFARYGLTQPVWDTEGSWNNAVGAMTDSDNQSAFVARWYLLHWSEGIQRAYWYAWDNEVTGTLWDSTSGEHKAANAYRQVYNWMVGAIMPSSCTWSGPTTVLMPTGTIGSCVLTRPGGYQALAVWNTDGPTPYTPSAIYTRYRDLDANAVTIRGTVTISYKPILLESPTSPASPRNLRAIPSPPR